MTRQQREQVENLDRELASYVSALEFDTLPETAVERTQRVFVDEVGVMLAGMADPASKTTARMMQRERDVTEPVEVLDCIFQTSRPEAALVLGTSGHALDYNNASMGVWHASAAPVAAISAIASREQVSGTEAITAYVAGFETQCALATPILPAHYERGWHATSTFGVFGATAAVASLLGLSDEETRHALNVAASTAAGIVQNFGTMAKPFHVGQAARSGVTAGMLADEGFTAARGALGPDGGFLDLYSGSDTPSPEARHDLDEEWALLEHGVSMKKYPCCSFTHSGIHAATSLRDEHDLDPRAIESVEVVASPAAEDILQYSDPQVPLERKFSMPFTIAAALVDGEVTIETFDRPVPSDSLLATVQDCVEFEVDPTLTYNSHETALEITMESGTQYSKTVEEPPGTPTNPLSEAELESKFDECAEYAPLTVPDQSYGRLRSLSSVDDVGGLFKACLP